MVKETSGPVGPVIVALAALALLICGPAAAAAKKHGSLRVTCDQVQAESAKTGAQLEAQLNAKGFSIESPEDIADNTLRGYSPGTSIDGWYAYKRCRTIGKRHFKGGGTANVLQGGGFIYDILSPGERPFPGETNPAIRRYDWSWTETVTRNRKGRLVDTVSTPPCTKSSFTGDPYDAQNVQTYPC